MICVDRLRTKRLVDSRGCVFCIYPSCERVPVDVGDIYHDREWSTRLSHSLDSHLYYWRARLS